MSSSDNENMNRQLWNDSPEPEVEQYRSVSKLALAAFFLAIFSPLAFFHLFFIVLPIAGLIFGVLAVIRISADSEIYTGLMLSRVAIFLSLLIGVAAPTNMYITRYTLVNQALDVANDFAEVIPADRPAILMQLMNFPWQRDNFSDYETIVQGYMSGESKERYEEFLAREDVYFFSALKDHISLENPRCTQYLKTSDDYRIQFNYDLVCDLPLDDEKAVDAWLRFSEEKYHAKYDFEDYLPDPSLNPDNPGAETEPMKKVSAPFYIRVVGIRDSKNHLTGWRVDQFGFDQDADKTAQEQ